MSDPDTQHYFIDCPQCGCEVYALHEGYCEDCCKANQDELDNHNSSFDKWEKMSDAQRGYEINDALNKAFQDV